MASEVLIGRLIGGVMLAAGLLMTLLGGLCTGWIVLPAMVEFWGWRGLGTLGDLWLVLAGGTATMAVGTLLARAGLRRIRDANGGGSSADEHH